MSKNIEIKATVPDLATIREKAAALASGPAQCLHQTDTFFAVPTGRLKVRAFPDGSGELISYERANDAGPTESVYTRVACAEAGLLSSALARALPIRGIVEKAREVFLAGRTRIHLDQVERLGSFVELEVVLGPEDTAAQGHRDARDLLQALEIPETALVAHAYIDLLEAAAEPCGLSQETRQGSS
jgi:adenylate cyclase class IV